MTSLPNWKRLALAAGLTASGFALPVPVQAAILTPGEPVPITGTHGKFDFIRIDTHAHRLLLGHEGNHSFDVFDLDAKRLLKVVPTGTSQDAAVDAKRGNYYVSGNDPGRMVIVSATDLMVTGKVPVPADTDLIAYDPATGDVLESNDTAPEMWVIDPAAKHLLGTVRYDGKGVEDLVLSPDNRRLYQAVKGSNTIAEVDLDTRRVLHQWPLAPDKNPHGIAFDATAGQLMVACAGKLVLLDASNGQILDRASIAQGVDEMAYDPGTHQTYCASRKGVISVVRLEGGKLVPQGDVPDHKTGSIAVDPATHTVWIGYGDADGAYVQSFTPSP